jgi:hypothetical protein
MLEIDDNAIRTSFFEKTKCFPFLTNETGIQTPSIGYVVWLEKKLEYLLKEKLSERKDQK